MGSPVVELPSLLTQSEPVGVSHAHELGKVRGFILFTQVPLVLACPVISSGLLGADRTQSKHLLAGV